MFKDIAEVGRSDASLALQHLLGENCPPQGLLLTSCRGYRAHAVY